MKLHELNPHIRYARIQGVSLANGHTVHICYDARLFFFENATGSVRIGKTVYEIKNNTTIYLPPKTRYLFNVHFAENTKAYTFNFDLVTDYSHITHSLGTATVYSFDPSLLPDYPIAEEFRRPIIREVSEIRNRLTECVHIYSEKRACHRERASALLKLCLLELLSQSKEGGRSDLCELVLDTVRKNFADPTLTNESIAKALNYHPYHINRVVKKDTGYALRTYIIEYRLGVAKNLLLTTKNTISQVAEACGFASTSYFTKLFKERNGIPPKDYRNSRIHSEI